MHLFVLTALTRPQNLPAIAESLCAPPGMTLTWCIRPDCRRESFYGQSIKRQLLNWVQPESWVWVCDDDNHAPPGFLPGLLAAYSEHPAADCFVVSQTDAAGEVLRRANRMIIGPDRIDFAQVVFKAGLAKGVEIPGHYGGDSRFIAAMHKKTSASRRWVYLSEVSVTYNALRASE